MAAGSPRRPTSFEAGIGGYMGASFSVALRNSALEYTWYDPGLKEGGKERIEPTARQWRAFRDKLDRWGVWDWKASYQETGIVDGTSWGLSIEWGDQQIKSGGSNEYPPHFDRLLKGVSTLIGRRDFR